jgi:hypothetical protein
MDFEANRRVRVTATRARNGIAGDSDTQFGSETAAPVSHRGHPAGTGAIAPPRVRMEVGRVGGDLRIRDGSIVRLPLVGYARISLADLVN